MPKLNHSGELFRPDIIPPRTTSRIRKLNKLGPRILEGRPSVTNEKPGDVIQLPKSEGAVSAGGYRRGLTEENEENPEKDRAMQEDEE